MSVSVSVELRRFTCGECGGVYAVGEVYAQKKEDEGGFWTCPYCKCGWGYPKEGSNVEKLKRQLAQAQRLSAQNRERADAEAAARLRAEEYRKKETAKLKRAQKRAVAGVCQCCNRYFPAPKMAAHMKTKHPDFVPGAVAKEP